MSLRKAIKYGKEKRKYPSRTACRKGVCNYCESNFTYNDKKKRNHAEQDLKEWKQNNENSNI